MVELAFPRIGDEGQVGDVGSEAMDPARRAKVVRYSAEDGEGPPAGISSWDGETGGWGGVQHAFNWAAH